MNKSQIFRTSAFFCIAMFCISCYLPAIHLFTDSLLLPKWYGCGLFGALLAMLWSVLKLLGKDTSTDVWMHFGCNVFIAISGVECLYVLTLAMMDGVPSIGALGTFDNPAGLALNLCVAMPLGVHQAWRKRNRKIVRWLYAVLCLLMVVTLYLTKSRTGMLCLVLYMIAYLYQGLLCVHISSFAKRAVFVGLFLCLLAGAIYGVFQQKASSTSGRAFILQRSWELIKEHPFKGHGVNGFERKYMECQANYFKTHPASEYAVLADEVHHPLNEFVYLWVDYGVSAPLALLGSMILPAVVSFKRKDGVIKPLLLPLLGVSVFSCFSYPFHYPVAWAVVVLGVASVFRWKRRMAQFALLMAGGVTMAFVAVDASFEYKWNEAYRHSFKDLSPGVLDEYEALHGYMHRNFYFLYNYAMTAFLSHDFDRAYALVEECGLHWNGYNRELLAGDICFKKHQCVEAMNHYTMAMHMCPVRFAPLEGLYKVYDAMGDETGRSRIAQKIASQQVKVHSSAVERIRRNCP